eukprot:5667922-Prymnesium_polylepis.1
MGLTFCVTGSTYTKLADVFAHFILIWNDPHTRPFTQHAAGFTERLARLQARADSIHVLNPAPPLSPPPGPQPRASPHATAWTNTTAPRPRRCLTTVSLLSSLRRARPPHTRVFFLALCDARASHARLSRAHGRRRSARPPSASVTSSRRSTR